MTSSEMKFFGLMIICCMLATTIADVEVRSSQVVLESEIFIESFENSKIEIIRKLRLHKEYLKTIRGNRNSDIYTSEFTKRADQMIIYLNSKNIRFVKWTPSGRATGSIMEVREHQRSESIININESLIGRFSVSNVYTQHVFCHELSHLIWWTRDLSHPSQIVKVPPAELCQWADWFNFLIIFADRQEELQKFYLVNKN